MPTIPPAFLDELRARTPLATLIGRTVRLQRSGRQWKGCCPLHGERTPSFYVYDDHFHCFGCGAHGDGVAFLMQGQGLSFPDAVAQLAAEVGLEVPRAPDPPGRAEAASAEARVLAALEDAARLFADRLGEAEGAPARRYLEARGIDRETAAAWRLGWAGGAGGLRAALAGRGHAAPTLVEAGLVSVDEDGAIRGEMFRARLTFPIADRRGRVIGFGARTLGDAQPKYLNGPETRVFSKRAVLYGLDRATARMRERAQPGGGGPAARSRLVIGEGYMDVLALARAGYAAVAPLGTALTEEQLRLAWALDPAPVLCLDGDAAGRRAAARAAERALPMLSPERSLSVATLEAGADPDSLLREHGADALRARIEAAPGLAASLYELLDPPGADATPERRAAFRARLEAAASRIPDRALASEYRRALLDRFFAGRGAARRARPGAGTSRRETGGRAERPVTGPRPALSASLAREEQGCMLALIASRHPELLHDVEEAWARVALPPWLVGLRAAILSAALEQRGGENHVQPLGGDAGMARAEELVRRRGDVPACAAPGAMPAEAEAGWWHFFGLMQHDRLDDEIEAARARLAGEFTEARVRQMLALIGARDELRTLDGGPAS